MVLFRVYLDVLYEYYDLKVNTRSSGAIQSSKNSKKNSDNADITSTIRDREETKKKLNKYVTRDIPHGNKERKSHQTVIICFKRSYA